MNINNMSAAIAIMERAGKVNMGNWQHAQSDDEDIYQTEQEMHECGTAACFAGWVAVSPEWKEAGGTISRFGEPCLKNINIENGLAAIYSLSNWLELQNDTVYLLVYPREGTLFDYTYGKTGERSSRKLRYSMYGVEPENVNAQHVIAVLKELIEKGERRFFEKHLADISSIDTNDNTYSSLCNKYSDIINQAIIMENVKKNEH